LIQQLVFAVAALITLASATMVVVNRHPVHSALYLVLTFLGMSVFFLQLRAPFLAAVQVIVYAGAIMVLFIFVIMLLGEDKPLESERHLGIQLPMVLGFVMLLAAEIGYLAFTQAGRAVPVVTNVRTIGGEEVLFGSVKALGNMMFTNYLFAFEAASVVLLIAMVGVVVLAKKKL
jgi:NADH-quinone oxidoreductase subunit J